MATSTVAWVVLLSATMLAAAHASDAGNFVEPSDVFGGLLARTRTSPNQLIAWEDDTIDTLSDVTPCSVPDKPDPRYYYPDFPECRKRNCPDCEPLKGLAEISDFHNLHDQPRPPSVPDMSRPQVQPRPASAPAMSRPEVQPRPPSVPDFSRPQVQPRPPSVSDFSRPQVQPRPPSAYDFSRPQVQPRLPLFPDNSQPQVQPRPLSILEISKPQVQPRPLPVPDQFRPQIEPMPPQLQEIQPNQVPDSTRNIPAIVPGMNWAAQPPLGMPNPFYPNPNCYPYPIITDPPSCPRETFIGTVLPPYQCPNVPLPNGVSPDDILKIIRDGGYCQTSDCAASVSELLLRLTLLEDRLRALVKCETRLKVYTNILVQIQQKVGESIRGNGGPPGEEGYMGQRGPRGGRGPPGQCNTQGGPPGGTPGPPGPDGSKGEYGPPGDKICDCDGLPGPIGFFGYALPGNPGPKGMKGQAGPRGQDLNPLDV